MIEEYKPDICPHCNQSTTYVLAIDRGTVKIVKQIARFIGEKGINAVHPRKEMEPHMLSSNEVGNLSRPRFHGLIAKVKGNAGNYVLTRKGGAFLNGKAIPKYAIISKAEGHNIGYWKAETETVTIHDFAHHDDTGFWEGINYTIEEGDIIRKKEPLQAQLF